MTKEILICDRCKDKVKHLYVIEIDNGVCFHSSRYEVCPQCRNEIKKIVERYEVSK